MFSSFFKSKLFIAIICLGIVITYFTLPEIIATTGVLKQYTGKKLDIKYFIAPALTFVIHRILIACGTVLAFVIPPIFELDKDKREALLYSTKYSKLYLFTKGFVDIRDWLAGSWKLFSSVFSSQNQFLLFENAKLTNVTRITFWFLIPALAIGFAIGVKQALKAKWVTHPTVIGLMTVSFALCLMGIGIYAWYGSKSVEMKYDSVWTLASKMVAILVLTIMAIVMFIMNHPKNKMQLFEGTDIFYVLVPFLVFFIVRLIFQLIYGITDIFTWYYRRNFLAEKFLDSARETLLGSGNISIESESWRNNLNNAVRNFLLNSTYKTKDKYISNFISQLNQDLKTYLANNLKELSESKRSEDYNYAVFKLQLLGLDPNPWFSPRLNKIEKDFLNNPKEVFKGALLESLRSSDSMQKRLADYAFPAMKVFDEPKDNIVSWEAVLNNGVVRTIMTKGMDELKTLHLHIKNDDKEKKKLLEKWPSLIDLFNAKSMLVYFTYIILFVLVFRNAFEISNKITNVKSFNTYKSIGITVGIGIAMLFAVTLFVIAFVVLEKLVLNNLRCPQSEDNEAKYKLLSNIFDDFKAFKVDNENHKGIIAKDILNCSTYGSVQDFDTGKQIEQAHQLVIDFTKYMGRKFLVPMMIALIISMSVVMIYHTYKSKTTSKKQIPVEEKDKGKNAQALLQGLTFSIFLCVALIGHFLLVDMGSLTTGAYVGFAVALVLIFFGSSIITVFQGYV